MSVRAPRVVGSTVPFTPDGRYIVVDGRLWRAANPRLTSTARKAWVDQLMTGRQAVSAALRQQDADALAAARARVHQAKVALGERGPVWWDDGAPDFSRYSVYKSPYATWFGQLRSAEDPPAAGASD